MENNRCCISYPFLFINILYTYGYKNLIRRRFIGFESFDGLSSLAF